MNAEIQAEWIKSQRRTIIKAINKVVAIVSEQSLMPHSNPRYVLEFDTGMAGRNVSLRIYDKSLTDCIDDIEYWGMKSVFASGWSSFDKRIIEERVEMCLEKLKNMRTMAAKYAALNNKEYNKQL